MDFYPVAGMWTKRTVVLNHSLVFVPRAFAIVFSVLYLFRSLVPVLCFLNHHTAEKKSKVA